MAKRIAYTENGALGTLNLSAAAYDNLADTASSSLRSFLLTGLDLKTLGATLIGTIPASWGYFHPLGAWGVLTAIGTPIAVASISLGITGAAYSDIAAIQALTGLTILNSMNNIPLVGNYSAVPSGTGIYVKVTTAGLATGAMTGSIGIFGHAVVT